MGVFRANRGPHAAGHAPASTLPSSLCDRRLGLCLLVGGQELTPAKDQSTLYFIAATLVISKVM